LAIFSPISVASRPRKQTTSPFGGFGLTHQAVRGVGVDRGQHQHVDALSQHVLDLRGLKRLVGVRGLREHFHSELRGLLLEEGLIGVAPAELVVVGHYEPDLQLLALGMGALEADKHCQQSGAAPPSA
jgi:hypothetical protein